MEDKTRRHALYRRTTTSAARLWRRWHLLRRWRCVRNRPFLRHRCGRCRRNRSRRRGRGRSSQRVNGWLARNAGWLHALHASRLPSLLPSFVPLADCTFSSMIGLTERPDDGTTDRGRRGALLSMDKLPAQSPARSLAGRPPARDSLAFFHASRWRTRTKRQALAGSGGGRALFARPFVAVLLILGSGSLWVLNQTD